VHSYGDVYVLMSYKGKEPSDERYTNVLVSEAYEVLMMAFDMLDTVAEMREKASTSLKDIDLQIGIHTGKILGGLIGKNFVRYDIFG
jgi:class 3 adenylate cyclase